MAQDVSSIFLPFDIIKLPLHTKNKYGVVLKYYYFRSSLKLLNKFTFFWTKQLVPLLLLLLYDGHCPSHTRRFWLMCTVYGQNVVIRISFRLMQRNNYAHRHCILVRTRNLQPQ